MQTHLELGANSVNIEFASPQDIDNECSICFEKFEPSVNNPPIYLHTPHANTPNHYLHRECYKKWVTFTPNAGCPICREPMDHARTIVPIQASPLFSIELSSGISSTAFKILGCVSGVTLICGIELLASKVLRVSEVILTSSVASGVFSGVTIGLLMAELLENICNRRIVLTSISTTHGITITLITRISASIIGGMLGACAGSLLGPTTAYLGGIILSPSAAYISDCLVQKIIRHISLQERETREFSV